MERSLRLAFCSMAAAISAALLLLTGVVPIGTYALPALAGLPMIAVVVEYGSGWAWPVYAAVSILSFFLAGDREAALWYILFFGGYPILKSVIEKRLAAPAAFLLKFAVFNAAAVLEFWLAARLLNVPADSYELFGVQSPWIFLAAGNLVFALYDYALTALVSAYCRRVHPRAAVWLRRK